MVFGTVNIQIGNYRILIVTKLIMSIRTIKPVEEHVHDVVVFCNDGIFCEPSRGFDVCLED